MHICVCMDTAADRKQLERLLGRSTDRRLAEDSSIPFYIQSYGNKEAVLKRPGMYDLFFIDLHHDVVSSVELAHELRRLGSTSNIVICPQEGENVECISESDDIYILRQPILKAELEKVMDAAVETVRNQVHTVDIRTGTETYEVVPENICYAEKIKDALIVHMADGNAAETTEEIYNLWERIRDCDKICYLSNKLIVNMDYIASVGFCSVTLTDKSKFKIKHSVAGILKKKRGSK